MHLLDDEQAGQEEPTIPRATYALATCYAAFWAGQAFSQWGFWKDPIEGIFFVGCFGGILLTSIGAVLQLPSHADARLKLYGQLIWGSEVLVIFLIGSYLFQWNLLMRPKIFILVFMIVMTTVGLFLTRYYGQREGGAAWWHWLERSILWYALLQLDVLLEVAIFISPFTLQLIVWVQLLLFFLGAGILLLWEFPRYTSQERRVGLLLLGSSSIFITVMDLKTDNTGMDLLVVLSLILLLWAIGKAQEPREKNSADE